MTSLSGADLSSVAGVVISLVTTFLTVAYLVSNGAEGLSTVLRWRERILMSGIEGVLDDPDFTGLARAVYNNFLFNPGGDGKAETRADLKSRPSHVDSGVFANALLQVLRLGPRMSEGNMLLVIETLPLPGASIADRQAAALRIEGLGVPAVSGPPPGVSQNIKNQARNIIQRHGGDWNAIVATTADLFDFAAWHWLVTYETRIKYTSFVLGFLLAAFLDLEPLASVATIIVKPVAKGAGAFGDAWAILNKVLEWTIVATSTLFGAPFWYSLLQRITGKSQPPKTNLEAGAASAAGPAGATGASPAGPQPS